MVYGDACRVVGGGVIGCEGRLHYEGPVCIQ